MQSFHKRPNHNPARTWLVSARILLILAAASIWSQPVERQEFSLHGLTLPRLIGDQKLAPAPKTRRVAPALIRVCELTLHLSPSGKVTRVDTDYAPADSACFAAYLPAVKKKLFTSARMKSKAIPFVIVARMLVYGFTMQDRAILQMPVDSTGSVVDHDLLERSFQASGVVSPGVVNFPSYFCPLRFADSMTTIPQAVIRIAVDSSGELTDRELTWTNDSLFAATALVVAGWGEYRTFAFKSARESSQFFLALRYFPDVQYPTSPWRYSEASPPLERERVRVFFPGEPIAFSAVPSKALSAPFNVPSDFIPDSEPVVALIDVTAEGEGVVRSIDGISLPSSRNYLKQFFGGRRYYPGWSFDKESGFTTATSPAAPQPRTGRIVLNLNRTDSTTFNARFIPLN